MRKNAIAFLSGLIFALGLALGGMTQPAKVLGFLDVAGLWDASLAFVMAGAVGLDLGLFRVILRRRTPILGGAFLLPPNTRIDGRLLVGAALFGVGWGLGGYCPGPGFVSLAGGDPGALVFVVAMIAGQVAHNLFEAVTVGDAAPESVVAR